MYYVAIAATLCLSLVGCTDEPQNSLEEKGDETSETTGGGAVLGVDTAESETLDLGIGLVIEGLSHLSISYNESLEDVCVAPNQMALAPADDEAFPFFSLIIPFYGAPSGTYTMNEAVSGVNGYGEDNETNYRSQAGFTESSTSGIDLAISGSVSVSIDAEQGTATLQLSDFVFESDESVVHSGSVTVDLHVWCVLLHNYPETEGDGQGCGWMTQRVPYTDEFCQDLTSEYPADVLR